MTDNFRGQDALRESIHCFTRLRDYSVIRRSLSENTVTYRALSTTGSTTGAKSTAAISTLSFNVFELQGPDMTGDMLVAVSAKMIIFILKTKRGIFNDVTARFRSIKKN